MREKQAGLWQHGRLMFGLCPGRSFATIRKLQQEKGFVAANARFAAAKTEMELCMNE